MRQTYCYPLGLNAYRNVFRQIDMFGEELASKEELQNNVLSHFRKVTLEGRQAIVDAVDGVDVIQQIIGDVTKNGRNVRENTGKINIEYDGYRVTISKTIRSHKGIILKQKKWGITAFYKSKPIHEKKKNIVKRNFDNSFHKPGG